MLSLKYLVYGMNLRVYLLLINLLSDMANKIFSSVNLAQVDATKYYLVQLLNDLV